jgi:hypothetical protein
VAAAGAEAGGMAEEGGMVEAGVVAAAGVEGVGAGAAVTGVGVAVIGAGAAVTGAGGVDIGVGAAVGVAAASGNSRIAGRNTNQPPDALWSEVARFSAAPDRQDQRVCSKTVQGDRASPVSFVGPALCRHRRLEGAEVRKTWMAGPSPRRSGFGRAGGTKPGHDEKIILNRLGRARG